MITEDYVSFEVAKLLKEKGFVEKTFTYFDNELLCNGGWFEWNNSPMGQISAPTLQMAIKWLRENNGIAVLPTLSNILDDTKFLWDIKIVVAKTGKRYSQGWVYESYERACEAAIKYCLENLI